MKKVLIALDYDPAAQRVAEVGFSLAKSMEADVFLLHVISDPVYYSSPEYSPIMGFSGYMDTTQFQLDNIDGLKNASQHYLDKTKLHLGDKNIETIVVEGDGDFAESILITAKHLHAEVIVLGSHGRRWLEDILLGSVTEKILRHSAIPLFIIPTKKHK